MYEKIAVVVDGTENALHAVKEAIELATVHNTRTVALVTVVSERAYSKANMGAIEAQGESQTKIMSPAMELLDKAGIKNQLVLLHGQPASEIVNYSKGANVDLIVIGDCYLKKIHKNAGSGSVTKQVSREATCPVLIVK